MKNKQSRAEVLLVWCEWLLKSPQLFSQSTNPAFLVRIPPKPRANWPWLLVWWHASVKRENVEALLSTMVRFSKARQKSDIH